MDHGNTRHRASNSAQYVCLLRLRSSAAHEPRRPRTQAWVGPSTPYPVSIASIHGCFSQRQAGELPRNSKTPHGGRRRRCQVQVQFLPVRILAGGLSWNDFTRSSAASREDRFLTGMLRIVVTYAAVSGHRGIDPPLLGRLLPLSKRSACCLLSRPSPIRCQLIER